jgi:predicted ribosomally synthesized peptide with nif11-like leader
MTTGDAKKFLEATGTDPALREELRSAVDAAMTQAVLGVARKHGFVTTLDELTAYVSGHRAELSEEDLGRVAGGVGGHGPELSMPLKISLATGGAAYVASPSSR